MKSRNDEKASVHFHNHPASNIDVPSRLSKHHPGWHLEFPCLLKCLGCSSVNTDHHKRNCYSPMAQILALDLSASQAALPDQTICCTNQKMAAANIASMVLDAKCLRCTCPIGCPLQRSRFDRHSTCVPPLRSCLATSSMVMLGCVPMILANFVPNWLTSHASSSGRARYK